MRTTKFWALAVLLSVVTIECHIVSRKYDSSASSLDTSGMQGEIEGTVLDFEGESSTFHDQDDEEDDEDSSCDEIAPERRLDCYPDPGPSDVGCLNRGCCWDNSTLSFPGGENIPFCFYGTTYEQTGYKMGKLEIVNSTFRQVKVTRSEPSHMPDDVMILKIGAHYQTNSRLRVVIYDPSNERYEIPQKFVERPVDQIYSVGTEPNYSLDMDDEGGFKLKISRSDGSLIMNALVQNFIYADQFLQLSFDVNGTALYGLGEHRGPLMYGMTDWKRVGIWARDRYPEEGINLYGSHPMYVMIEEGGTSHGVVVMNSNAMDVTIQPSPIVTWRTIGGILDFYILTGPSPNDVIKQYFDLIGRPHLPPYWALGFHLGRWGYGSAANTWDVVKRTRYVNFPQEVQWNDIDYMDRYQDFTYSNETYAQLPDLVADLHKHKQKYIMILDPGISDKLGSDAFVQGSQMGIWIRNATGYPLEGQVWPGTVFYPDFTHSKVDEYWYDQTKSYHDKIPYDGVWIDMNEPSNFMVGSSVGCTNNTLDNPPYTPQILDNSLQSKTICPSAVQEAGSHYNIHNLYGHTEGIATRKALDNLFTNKRSPIISRSSFMGSGRNMGHWTGDNQATWNDIKYSIAATINTNIFGISFTGVDICGFMDNTTSELCVRWMQMGAFYTFMRNHNTIGTIDQDPAMFPQDERNIMKKYTLLRYRYLPYLYTQMFKASTEGMTVLKSLAFEFPNDTKTYSIDTQFMWGPSFMVCPALEPNIDQIKVYFPRGTSWYTVETTAEPVKGGVTLSVDAPLKHMPIYVKSGSIIVSQKPELYLDDARVNDFTIEIFMSNDTEASGYLFWDDGSEDLASENYLYVKFTFKKTDVCCDWVFICDVLVNNYKNIPKLTKVQIYGLQDVVVRVEDEKRHVVQFTTSKKPSKVVLENLDFELTENFNIFLMSSEKSISVLNDKEQLGDTAM